jgi:eukaryotic-like serine/threonine-protein kinase
MTPELWERLNPLFMQAVERLPPERDAFIAEVCGTDSELRAELAALVAVHAQQEATAENIDVIARRLVATAAHGTLRIGDLLLGRFRIVRHLGSGGMGDVYEAFDAELSHPVALKLIRSEIIQDDILLARFKKEVQLARRLSGPNICRIHEFFVLRGKVGSNNGAFLTMELLEGVTLAERLKDGPLPQGEAEAVAVGICMGLCAIHGAGIVHRDLKTRNIMLAKRDGSSQAVLMDFGLACDLSPEKSTGETALTLPGALMGTPAYMAPEQFEGTSVTPAADIYALGIVLYELSTGRHPFASSNAIGTAILRGRRLNPASSVNRAVPHRWDSVIERCLEFEPSRRYQSADEVARSLRSSKFRFAKMQQRGMIAVLPGIGLLVMALCTWFIPPLRERLEGVALSNHAKHIAILPFEISDTSQETALLGEGLMDSLTGKLSNLDRTNDSLWVIPASEVRRRKVSDPGSALREFGATIVVKGSFSRLNHVVRLSLELIDTRKMREIGFANIESGEEDLGGLQDEMVKKLGRMINVSIKDADARADEGGANGIPYENYLTALGYLERYDMPGNLDGAIRSLTEAVTSAPRFALALGALGHAYTLRFLIDKHPDSLKLAHESCTRALAFDDLNPDLHATLAELDEIEGRYELAEKEFQRVMSLDPHNVEAAAGLASVYVKEGRIADAEREYINASKLRPEDWKGYDALGRFYDNIGRQREAIIQFEHGLSLTPDNAYVYCNLGGAYIDSNDPTLFPAAEKALNRSIALNPSYEAYANLGNLYGLEHRFRESADATRKALDMSDEDFDVWDNLMQAYEALGEEDKASAARSSAMGLAERAIRLNSRNAEAHSVLASLLAKNNAREEALYNIRTALALAPKDQEILSEVAEAYEVLGERNLAIKYLHLALQNGFPRIQIDGVAELKRVSGDPKFQRYGE